LAGLQSALGAYLPRQQYWLPPSLAQAEMQPTTLPPALTSSTFGQTTALVQPAFTQPFELTLLVALPPDTLMYIGRLDPSTMDTS
jgi:hypothetical protein